MENDLTTIVLAAGMGTRLGELTKTKPKILQEVGHKTILQYSLSWMNALRPSKKIVIGGYLFDQVATATQKFSPDTLVLENKDYETTQRLSSLLVARTHIRGAFLSYDGDYIFTESVARMIQGRTYKNLTMHVATKPSPYEELDYILTCNEKWHLEGAYKTKGTEALPSAHSGYFNSILYCPASVREQFFSIADEVLAASETGMVHVEEATLAYAKKYPVDVIDLGEPIWIEVDNPAELTAAEKFVVDFKDTIAE
jgi:choline kinase